LALIHKLQAFDEDACIQWFWIFLDESCYGGLISKENTQYYYTAQLYCKGGMTGKGLKPIDQTVKFQLL
jgi:hypothetical protein